MKRAAAVLMLALLVGCQPQGEPSRGLAVVVDVIDGDTLTVDTAEGERVAMSTPLGPGMTARNGPTLRETSDR